MDIKAALQAQGLEMPPAPAPAGSYVPAVQTGNLLVIAGQLPFEGGMVAITGHLGDTVSIEEGQQAARLCVLNALSIIDQHVGGDWNKVKRVVRVGGFVASTPTFTAHPQVINGASDLLVAVLGDKGRHARAAVGVAALPLEAAVEVEMMVELG